MGKFGGSSPDGGDDYGRDEPDHLTRLYATSVKPVTTRAAPARKVVYLIGSLRNPAIPTFAKALEEATGYEVFADWFAAGPEADDRWRDYVATRWPDGGIVKALDTHAARHVFDFDKTHIDRADAVVLLMPAGKSGFMELGYAAGQGKPAFIVFNEDPERYDVMLRFATGCFLSMADLLPELKRRVG